MEEGRHLRGDGHAARSLGHATREHSAGARVRSVDLGRGAREECDQAEVLERPRATLDLQQVVPGYEVVEGEDGCLEELDVDPLAVHVAQDHRVLLDLIERQRAGQRRRRTEHEGHGRRTGSLDLQAGRSGPRSTGRQDVVTRGEARELEAPVGANSATLARATVDRSEVDGRAVGGGPVGPQHGPDQRLGPVQHELDSILLGAGRDAQRRLGEPLCAGDQVDHAGLHAAELEASGLVGPRRPILDPQAFEVRLRRAAAPAHVDSGQGKPLLVGCRANQGPAAVERHFHLVRAFNGRGAATPVASHPVTRASRDIVEVDSSVCDVASSATRT
ncbi:hypothetical protein Pla86_30870 [Planctomycetes bacterium Pla86]|uniref:Uncharacterized protein n=1 Tax=Engelhardtia mirabilis TaxID=2528011 RepID=A0A518BM18_9BACT|nr:hypothetical protein Pla133_30880 [Planctomycetes bacterium Pla133]QDV02323.1 hypothetical protein Pla86_30870 [Planctomycetes bacterium Pla86]